MPDRLDKIHGFVRIYYETRYLVLFGSEKYDSIYSRVRCLISTKSGLPYTISHNYVKSKVDSYDFLPLEKAITFHNVLILIKSVFNKDKNDWNYYIFVEKASCKLPKE